ncbi:MAG: serine protease [Myxococcota bacterium]
MKTRFALATLFAAVLSSACGDELEVEETLGNESNEIIDGDPANTIQAQQQGALFVSRAIVGRRFICGASYIGSNADGEHWALTAAHCVDGETRGLRVGFGKTRRNSYRDSDLTRVEALSIHRDWDRESIQNDIAVLRLERRPPAARVVELTPSGAPSFAGEVADVVGFGRGSNGALHQAQTRILSTSNCIESYPFITSSHLCIRDNVGAAQSVCSGDSGGPLYIRATGQQAGIASFAEADCRVDVAQGYTRVSAFRNWIRAATGI